MLKESKELSQKPSKTATATSENSRITGINKLSETAKSYLNEVQKKYPKTNITVTDFSSNNQSLNYRLGSSGNYNVAISANMVENMASDPKVAAKYENAISDLSELDENMKQIKSPQSGLFICINVYFILKTCIFTIKMI